MILVKIQKWIEKISVVLSAVLCAVMMCVLLANVILRYVPGVGGFSWYMEGSQYLNVWSMFIVGIGLACKGDNLRVNIIEDLCGKNKISKVIQKIFVDVLMIVMYAIAAYAFNLLYAKGLKVRISTMQNLRMGYVYVVIMVSAALSALGYVLDMIVSVLGLDKKEVK